MKANSVCRVWVLLLLAASAVLGGSNWTIDFQNNSLDDWYLPDAEGWTVKNEDGNRVLHLTEGGLMGRHDCSRGHRSEGS